MNLKSLTLVVITAIVVGVAWKVSQDKAPQTEVQRSALHPDLLARVNDAARMTLRSAEHETVLLRDGDSWLIENKDRFPATAANVKRTLLQLASLRTIEAKTSSAERYARLGVEDVTGGDASGTVIEVLDGAQQQLVALILGNPRGGAASDQYYVRRSGEAQAWLVEGALEAPADPIRWLDAQIADVDTARVREVRITPAEGRPVVITKAEANDNFFALQNIPEGYQAKSKATVSSIGAVLLDLRMNDVAAASRVADLTPIRHIELETFDGLLVSMDEYTLEDEAVVHFDFRYDAALVTASAADNGAGESSGNEEKNEAADADASGVSEAANADTAVESVAQEAARLQARNGAWIYALPNYKQRMINRDLDSLIEQPEDES